MTTAQIAYFENWEPEWEWDMSYLKIDMDKVHKLIEEGYISVRPHPTAPLFIYNYTPKCQFDWHWTRETTACRGLILDKQERIVARPFPKFFTPNQYKELRSSTKNLFGLKYKELYKGGFSVSEKADGSLGIAYYHPDCGMGIATRGSFESDQAKHATKILEEKYGTFPFQLDFTYLFEIIYPENRIVVNYGQRDELVLLTVLDNATGEDRKEEVDEWRDAGHPTVETFNFSTFDDVLECQSDDDEGFVVKFDNGLRVKVKFDEYLRLHRILTHVSARDIWWRVRNEENLDDLLGLVPDEFYNWVRGVESKLRIEYDEIYQHVQAVIYKELVKRDPPLTRKQMAIKYSEYKYKAVMFQVLDNKEYRESIWRLLKPKAERPFKNETTGSDECAT